MKRFVLDACTIHLGTVETPSDLSKLTELGLTNGGVTINITPNVREIEFDGKRERKIKDMSRILGYEAGVETSGLEINEESLSLSLIKKDATFITDENYKKYVPSNTVEYKDLVVVGQLHGSKPMIVVLKNCFNEDGFSLETADSSEGTYSLKAYAHYEYDPIKDVEGTNLAPVVIYLPKEDGTVQRQSIDEL